MVHRVVNRLLHCVIKNVDIVAQEHGPAEAAKLIDGIVQQARKVLSETDNDEGGQ